MDSDSTTLSLLAWLAQVRLKLQRAVQHRFATSATGREGKARNQDPGSIMENQMEKKMENEMETGIIWGLY